MDSERTEIIQQLRETMDGCLSFFHVSFPTPAANTHTGLLLLLSTQETVFTQHIEDRHNLASVGQSEEGCVDIRGL